MYRIIRNKLYYLYFCFFKYIKFPTCKIYTNNIHPTAKLGKYLRIEKHTKIAKGIEIGDHTYINEYTRIDKGTSRIGKYCSIAYNVKIGMGPHPLDRISTSPVFYSTFRGYVKVDTYDTFADKGLTEIGHDVYIAANVIIYAGVTVGTGAVIAAGSVVTKDIPPYAFVAGMPAKIIRYRFKEEEIEKLLLSKWWNLSVEELLMYRNEMDDVNKFIKKIENRAESLKDILNEK